MVEVPHPSARCVSCRQPLKPEAKFCSSCGASARPNYSLLKELAEGERPIKRLLVFYALWLSTGVASAWIHHGEVWIAATLAIQILDGAFTIFWLLAAARPVLALYRRFRCGWAWYLIPIAAAWPIAALVSGFVWLLNTLFSQDPNTLSPDYLNAGFGWGVVILSVCVQPALIEEMAFRGIIQTSLGSMMKARDAILVSAAAFSIMHFSPIMFLPFLVIGSYLGWLRFKSDSIYPCMIAHFLHNFIVTIDEAIPILPF